MTSVTWSVWRHPLAPFSLSEPSATPGSSSRSIGPKVKQGRRFSTPMSRCAGT